MSREIQILSSYFLFVEFSSNEFNDPNMEMSRQEIETRYKEAYTFQFAIQDLILRLDELESTDPVDIQTIFYDVGKAHFGIEKSELFRFFSLLYMTIWQRSVGPRFGVFANLYGKNEFTDLIRERYNAVLNWI